MALEIESNLDRDQSDMKAIAQEDGLLNPALC